MSLSSSARSALTVAVLVLLLVLGLVWGWVSVTAPVPQSAAPQEACVPTDIAEGEAVRPDQVVVSILNASRREGLAGRTMSLFEDAGFVAGDHGNAPPETEVSRAQVWAADPDAPSVLLVRSWLGKGTRIVAAESSAPGVVVVVGDKFDDLTEGRRRIVAAEAATICSPPDV